MLSCLSVSCSLVSCLRYRCSLWYLCISPLHHKFRLPHLHSSQTVSMAPLQLSCSISPLTYLTAYALFKPNKSGQRLHPPYYRGCWHGVSRCLFARYRQAQINPSVSFQAKEVYNPEGCHPSRGMAGSGFPPLTNIPYCCLP